MATKCSLAVSAMTLVPVWITWPEGFLASLQGASVTAADSRRTTPPKRTLTHQQAHTNLSPAHPSPSSPPKASVASAWLESGCLKAEGWYRRGSSCCCRTNTGTPEITDGAWRAWGTLCAASIKMYGQTVHASPTTWQTIHVLTHFSMHLNFYPNHH